MANHGLFVRFFVVSAFGHRFSFTVQRGAFMNVLVTGTDGYLGSLLAPVLMGQGFDVTGVDTGYHRAGWLYNPAGMTVKTLNKDLREIVSDDLKGIEAVVHMAELSNDPAGDLAPHITYAINHRGSVRLAEIAKAAGVRRFIYMSSCSVYGVGTDDYVDENTPTSPQTAYAICKTFVERDVRTLANDAFSPTFFRNATAFGASPRMRFDIVLNNLCGLAFTTREIKMTSDGSPWRPLVHGLDICRAIAASLNAPRENVHNEIMNVGDTAQNYRVREIAEIVGEVFPGCAVSFGAVGSDNRSYRVSFEKIHKHLPSFRCAWDARRGARQLLELFKRINFTAEMFQHRGFTRLKQLEYLLKTGQIDSNFFWTKTDFLD